ncbi:MAG: LLM class F420-dependent oxidoreductase [bacterium]|nr:LLM class F420-dependent oxidoreductase [bacterium]MCP5069945.1 LLM class F420-dependent oxidoreductase [bacterium]
MRIGLNIGYSGPRLQIDIERVKLAESLGFDSVWTAEAYGSDAITSLAWIAAQTTTIKLGTAILQMPARTPAMTAMTAISLDQLSGGRFLLGIGPSGPQVVEGWHGVAYGKPLTRTREYVKILRAIFAREAPLEHKGEQYQIPFQGEGATGLGKPLKSILHGRADIPIFTASIGPAGIACSAEVADGLIPVWMNPERMDLIEPHLGKGFAKAGGGKSLDAFRIAPFVGGVLGDDLEQCRMPMRGMMALYIGGMGARGKNFYNDYATRLGYGEAAGKIQDLYLDGKKAEAMAAVPNELIDEVALVGPKERIAERLQAWKASPVTDMLISGGQPELFEVLAENLL